MDTTQKTKKKEAQVSCFVTAYEYEQIKQRAETEGRSISNFARQKILKENPQEAISK